MEQLLHYIWRHRMMPLGPLATTDGQPLEIIDPGLANANAGPDFFNAKLRIGGVLWVGNVEIHVRSTDWYMHGHDQDHAYDNVVLHVASVVDADVHTADGKPLPQLQLAIPPHVMHNYRALLAADRYPPCRDTVAALPRLTLHSWMSALGAERLDGKSRAMVQRVGLSGGSWEEAFFRTLGRSFGFGVNSDAFERWAAAVPLLQVAHHRDDPFQVEALFLGSAGLLDVESMNARQRQQAEGDAYFQRLRGEWAYLSRKFALGQMPRHTWRFLRLRPQNMPYIRMAQLATLYCSRHADLGAIVSAGSLDDVRRALACGVSQYWRTHYTPGSESRDTAKHLSAASVDSLVINAVVPMLHAYGQHRNDERIMARATQFLESMPPEDNNIVRLWAECGLGAQNAADTQAIIQLQQHYCERRDCLRCRFGYYSLKSGGER